MRFLIPSLLLLVCSQTSFAETFVYVSKAPEQAIQIYRFRAADGSLTSVETFKVDGTPGMLTTDPERKFLFATLRSKSTIASFRIDGATGKLTLLSSVPLEKGANAAYVATDGSGRFLLSASYMGGKVVVHRIQDDGVLVSPTLQIVLTAATAHATVFDPDNRFVFVPHVTPNAIYQFHFDAKTGELKEAGKAPGGSEKAGPRHLAFHPTLSVAYSSDETGNRITAYDFKPAKGLLARETLSTLPVDFAGKNTTAEVKVHPSGKFVWVSNRGHDSLAGFTIDEAGKLKSIGHAPTQKTPRSFDIDPDGRYLFSAGEGSGKLAVFKINRMSGELALRHTIEVGKSLTWVSAVKLAGK